MYNKPMLQAYLSLFHAACCVPVVKIRYIRATLLFSQQETLSACCVSVVKIRVAWLYLIFTTGTQQPEIDSNMLAT